MSSFHSSEDKPTSPSDSIRTAEHERTATKISDSKDTLTQAPEGRTHKDPDTVMARDLGMEQGPVGGRLRPFFSKHNWRWKEGKQIRLKLLCQDPRATARLGLTGPWEDLPFCPYERGGR